MGKKRTRRRLRVLFISAVIGAIAAGIVGGVLPKLEIAMSQSSPSPSASKPVPTPSPTPIASVELPCAVGQRAIEAHLLTLGMVKAAIETDQFDWIPEEINRTVVAYEDLRLTEDDFMQQMLIDIALVNLKSMSEFVADRPYLSRADKLAFVAIWKDNMDRISAPILMPDGESIREDYLCP